MNGLRSSAELLKSEDVRFSIARLEELRRMRAQKASPTPQMLAVVAFVALGLAAGLAVSLTVLFARPSSSFAVEEPSAAAVEEEQSFSVVIGVALCLTACTLNALGMNLQRLGQTKASPALNIAGVVLQAACGIVDITSYSFAPQSLLAPLSSLTLVLNLLVAPLMHEGDKLTAVDLTATMLVFAGIAVSLSFGSDATGLRTPDEMWALATQPRFLIYAAAMGALLAALLARIWLHERAAPAHGEGGGGGSGGSEGGRDSGGSGAVSAAALGGALRSGEVGAAESSAAVCYPAAAGILAGASVFGAKTLSELVRAGGIEARILAPMAIVTLCVVLAQVVTLNRGLGRHSPLFVVPIFIATLVLTNICGGAIFFNEFEDFTPTQVCVPFCNLLFLCVSFLISFLLLSKPPAQWRMYPSGALLVIVGVLLLATRAMGAEKQRRIALVKGKKRARTLSEAGPRDNVDEFDVLSRQSMNSLHRVPSQAGGSLHKRGNSTDSEGDGGAGGGQAGGGFSNRLRQRGGTRMSPRHAHGSETMLSEMMMPGLEDM